MTFSVSQMQLLDGKGIAAAIRGEIATAVQRLREETGRVPHLAAILVGNDGASETYVAHKVRACQQVGFNSTLLRLDQNTSEESLLDAIYQLNDNEDVDGIIVQLPLPAHIQQDKVMLAIDYRKDVDGLHPLNVGRVAKDLPAFIAATPYGILKLIERYKIETTGKHCVILGRSQIVGSPMSILMSRKAYPGNCTVTICHSRTKNVKDFTRSADILIVALGKPGFVTASMVKDGAVVIDVGITRVADTSVRSGFRLKGDVNFDEVAPKCSYITPVPGGVGPMTVVALLLNTLKAARKEIYS